MKTKRNRTNCLCNVHRSINRVYWGTNKWGNIFSIWTWNMFYFSVCLKIKKKRNLTSLQRIWCRWRCALEVRVILIDFKVFSAIKNKLFSNKDDEFRAVEFGIWISSVQSSYKFIYFYGAADIIQRNFKYLIGLQILESPYSGLHNRAENTTNALQFTLLNFFIWYNFFQILLWMSIKYILRNKKLEKMWKKHMPHRLEPRRSLYLGIGPVKYLKCCWYRSSNNNITSKRLWIQRASFVWI